MYSQRMAIENDSNQSELRSGRPLPQIKPDRHRQAGRQAGRRGPLPEPDDDRSNNQPVNTTNDSINRSIELNQSFDIGPSLN